MGRLFLFCKKWVYNMISQERLQNNFDMIGQISGSGAGITRLAFSEENWGARRFVIKLMTDAGLIIRTDNFGNVIGRREGSNPKAPVVMCGSHIDSVPNGGNFDGVLGVLSAIEVIYAMNEAGFENYHPIEIVVFMCEESSRFGVATLGSKAMCGKLDETMLKKLTDKDGNSLYSILKMRGLNADEIQDSLYTNQLKAFLEMHIEQGKVLESQQKQIGLVTGIAAPTRLNVNISGHADHSGATPMNLRHDALCTAAEIVLMVEETAVHESENFNPVVATVGVLQIKPNVMNIIPGDVNLKIDVRSIHLDSKIKVVRSIQQQMEAIALERGMKIDIDTMTNENPVILDASIIDCLEKICTKQQLAYMKLPSGAGHDAMQWAPTVPTGMIFIPCTDGLSHCPEEWAEIEDIVAGTKVLYDALCELSSKDE